eukprot:2130285-Rhodomonas_salina.2
MIIIIIIASLIIARHKPGYHDFLIIISSSPDTSQDTTIFSSSTVSSSPDTSQDTTILSSSSHLRQTQARIPRFARTSEKKKARVLPWLLSKIASAECATLSTWNWILDGSKG